MANVITPLAGYLEYNDPGSYSLNIASLGIVAPVSFKIRGAAGLGSVGDVLTPGNGGGGSAYGEGVISEFPLDGETEISGIHVYLYQNGNEGDYTGIQLTDSVGAYADPGKNGDSEGYPPREHGSIGADGLTLDIAFNGGDGSEGDIVENYSGGGGGGAGSEASGADGARLNGGDSGNENGDVDRGGNGSDSDYTAKGGDGGGQARVILEWTPLDPPVISSNGGGSTASISVAENTQDLNDITCSVEDGVTYSITGGADADKFQFVGETNQTLSFIDAPDFENPTDADTDNVYVVIVTATNAGGTDSQTISVTVTDVADSPPTITSSATFSVQENQTAIATLTATGTGSIGFDVNGGADVSKFTLDKDTGILAFAVAPDYESPTDANTDNVYVLNITADSDFGFDMQTISVTVTNDPSDDVVPSAATDQRLSLGLDLSI